MTLLGFGSQVHAQFLIEELVITILGYAVSAHVLRPSSSEYTSLKKPACLRAADGEVDQSQVLVEKTLDEIFSRSWNPKLTELL
jgi:hypothetical protein